MIEKGVFGPFCDFYGIYVIYCNLNAVFTGAIFCGGKIPQAQLAKFAIDAFHLIRSALSS